LKIGIIIIFIMQRMPTIDGVSLTYKLMGVI